MATSPAALTAGAVVGTTPVVLYTCPPSTHAKITAALFTNATGLATSLSVTITRLGGAALAAIGALPLSANQAYPSPELSGQVLNPGDLITATATTAASVNVQMSGWTF